MSTVAIETVPNTSSYNRSGDRSKNNTMSHPKPFAVKGIPPKPVRLENIRGESPTAPTFHFERVSRLLILDLEADLGSYQSFCSPGGVSFGAVSMLPCTL